MLTGFEEITKDLTLAEKEQARHAWKYITEASKRGMNAPNNHIALHIKKATGKKPSAALVRKMIAWMHTEGHLQNLIATGSGYRIAKTEQELRDYHESQSQRINAINARKQAVERDLTHFLNP